MKTKYITKAGVTFKVPVIKNLNSKIWKEIKNHPDALDASEWNCGTSHCRGGWAVALAGKEGKKLKDFCRKVIFEVNYASASSVSEPSFEKFASFQFAKYQSTFGKDISMAAELIYLASTGKCPDFYCLPTYEMRESIKRAAARERAKKQKVSK